jgi:predicted Zn-dependent protease with MMP-like domain/Flp pilus assembly protein TadD
MKPATEALLDQAMKQVEDGEPEKALELADKALAGEPKCSEAHHVRAEALVGLERFEDALEALEETLGLDPKNAQAMLQAADLYLHAFDGEPEEIAQSLELADKGLALARKEKDTELQGEFELLLGKGFSHLGDPKAALAHLDQAKRLLEGDSEVLLERGIALFEGLRLKEAREELEALLEEDPKDVWGHHYLGLVCERLGDDERAKKAFSRARRLAPEDFPKELRTKPAAFEKMVEAALERLPEKIRAYLSNVSITVEEIPEESDLVANDPPLSPQSLGLFRGSALGEKGVMDPWSHFPSSIVLYQKNLERFAKGRDELVEEIEVTLLHEVGHFLGLDEEDLYERGLD